MMRWSVALRARREHTAHPAAHRLGPLCWERARPFAVIRSSWTVLRRKSQGLPPSRHAQVVILV